MQVVAMGVFSSASSARNPCRPSACLHAGLQSTYSSCSSLVGACAGRLLGLLIVRFGTAGRKAPYLGLHSESALVQTPKGLALEGKRSAVL